MARFKGTVVLEGILKLELSGKVLTDWSYRVLKSAERYLERLHIVDQERITNLWKLY